MEDLMKSLLPLLLSPSLLVGCGVISALDRIDQANYRSQCSEFGFQVESEAFANCVMQQSMQDQEQNQRNLDRMQLQDATSKLRRTR
jgi:hypothetical protein